MAAIFEDRRPWRDRHEVGRLAAGDAKNGRKSDGVCGGRGKRDRPGGRDRPNRLQVPWKRVGADGLVRWVPDPHPNIVLLPGDRIGDMRRVARTRVSRHPDVGAQPPVRAAVTNDETAHCRSLDCRNPTAGQALGARLIYWNLPPSSSFFEAICLLNLRTRKIRETSLRHHYSIRTSTYTHASRCDVRHTSASRIGRVYPGTQILSEMISFGGLEAQVSSNQRGHSRQSRRLRDDRAAERADACRPLS